MRNIQKQTRTYDNGNILFRYEYYNFPEGGRILHGLYECYQITGEIALKVFIRHQLNVGLGLSRI